MLIRHPLNLYKLFTYALPLVNKKSHGRPFCVNLFDLSVVNDDSEAEADTKAKKGMPYNPNVMYHAF